MNYILKKIEKRDLINLKSKNILISFNKNFINIFLLYYNLKLKYNYNLLELKNYLYEIGIKK